MKIIWSREALAEREAIWLYLADRSIGYADHVERRLIARGDSLARFPRQGRRLTRDDCRLSIPDTQYVIDYRIEDDAIRILRVRSTAQDYE